MNTICPHCLFSMIQKRSFPLIIIVAASFIVFNHRSSSVNMKSRDLVKHRLQVWLALLGAAPAPPQRGAARRSRIPRLRDWKTLGTVTETRLLCRMTTFMLAFKQLYVFQVLWTLQIIPVSFWLR